MPSHFSVPGIAQPTKEIPISVYENEEAWSLPSYQNAVVLVDRAVSQTISHVKFCEHPLTVTLDSSEQIKSADFLKTVIETHPDMLKKFDAMIVIGGGTLLNFGTALAAHLNKICAPSSFHLILIPTNVLSMADVAYGSLGKLNKTATSDAVRVSYDPDRILIDTRFLKNLSPDLKKQGVAECLKHALLQDAPKFLDCLHLLRSENPSVGNLLSCILLTIKAKADVVFAMNRGYTSAEYLLTYGHVDAEPRENAAHFELSHGDSVLLSLAAELAVAGRKDILNAVLAVLPFTSLFKIAEKINFNRDVMREAYRHSAKPRFRAGDDNYFVIELPRLGAYAEIRHKSLEIKLKKCSFENLYDAACGILAGLVQLKQIKDSNRFLSSKHDSKGTVPETPGPQLKAKL